MKIREVILSQNTKLKEICEQKGVDYNSLKILLDSVRSKKLMKRNNYHQQRINDIIEKETK